MIDPKELRIRNWVTIDNPLAWPEMAGIPVVVTSVEESLDEQFPESQGTIRLKDERDTYCQYSEFISPIPLTPEWLERLGRRLITGVTGRYSYQNGYYTFVNGLFLKECANGFVVVDLDYVNGAETDISREIQFVHTLQNTAFALTGEEL